MKAVYSEKQESYQAPYVLHYGHRAQVSEVSARPREIARALASAGLADFIAPRTFPREHLTAVHTEDYLDYLKTGPQTPMVDPESEGQAVEVLFPSIWPYSDRWPVEAPTVMAKVGYYCFDTETPVTPQTYDAAMLSANCALTAADLLQDTQKTAYALCRPPGHHAMRSKCGGYCYLNNAAIAASYLVPAGRIAILDVDYHHGNGTQDIFYDSDRVLYVSIHADPTYAYPHYSGFAAERGSGVGAGYNLNLPLDSGTTEEEYARTLQTALSEVQNYRPRYLIVSLGLDTYEDDPICDFKLTPDYYGKLAGDIAALNIPSLIIQEGGYKVDMLGQLAGNFLQGWQDAAGV